MRILPLTIFALFLLFGVKLIESFWVETPAYAIDASAASDEDKKEEKKKEKKKSKKKKKKDKDAKKDKETDDTSEEDGEKKEKKKKKKKPKSLAGSLVFEQSEVELLQALAERRKKIESRIEGVEKREALLKAAEKRLDKKIDDLAGIKKEIQDLISKLNSDEEEKMRSLVAVYEKMKAKNAAVIFNDMDNMILLNLFARMKVKQTALILSKMKPEKAQEVTALLAKEGEKLRNEAARRLRK